ncbi:Transcriptional corepressor SEUSS [Morella rubra]|uniref:Transcriptional corepressor SEUSS n=1 Tax=Morella rubra TaxID=262757 RepID=A0A6A1VCU2_9ROSI|nr:Transcriptional corepressor SEUSS [Morella rubra]
MTPVHVYYSSSLLPDQATYRSFCLEGTGHFQVGDNVKSMFEFRTSASIPWFVASAHQLAKALELPLVNDLGYSKRYVRCLQLLFNLPLGCHCISGYWCVAPQIADVVNIMKDLIDYSGETGNGPMESLANFTCGARSLSGLHNMAMKTEWQQLQQQIMGPNLVKEHSLQGTAMPPSTSTSVASGSNSVSSTSTLTSGSTVAWLLHENSLNPQHENEMNNPSSSCAGIPFQIPPAVSSTTQPPAQLNPSSTFLSPTHSSSNNPPQFSYDILPSSATANHINSPNSAAEILLYSAKSKEANHESQNSFEKILREI